MASQKKIEKKAKRDKLRQAERRLRTKKSGWPGLDAPCAIPSTFMTGLNP